MLVDDPLCAARRQVMEESDFHLPISSARKIGFDHYFHKLVEFGSCAPFELSTSFGGIAQQSCHFRRPLKGAVHPDMFAPIEPYDGECSRGKITHAIRLARRD